MSDGSVGSVTRKERDQFSISRAFVSHWGINCSGQQRKRKIKKKTLKAVVLSSARTKPVGAWIKNIALAISHLRSLPSLPIFGCKIFQVKRRAIRRNNRQRRREEEGDIYREGTAETIAICLNFQSSGLEQVLWRSSGNLRRVINRFGAVRCKEKRREQRSRTAHRTDSFSIISYWGGL